MKKIQITCESSKLFQKIKSLFKGIDPFVVFGTSTLCQFFHLLNFCSVLYVLVHKLEINIKGKLFNYSKFFHNFFFQTE